MKESMIFTKSKKFASRVVKLYKFLCDEKKEYILSKQILRSGTSIGANLAEAAYASSRKDFANKQYIALKECSETLYWLELLKDNDYLTEEWFNNINNDCEEIKKMLSSSTKSITSNLQPPTSNLSQSGRSLIEMLGVLAIAGVMTAGAISMYNVVRTRQIRMVAVEDLKAIASNTKLLYAARRDFGGISTDYLVKSGVMKTEKSPLAGADFSVFAHPGVREFALVLNGLDFKTCGWLATVKLDWADRVSVNGYFESAATYCRKADKNEVAVWVK